MLGILISACLNVTLYNIILIYMSLFYIAQHKDSTAMFCVILFWSSFFMLIEYLTGQFDIVNDNPEMREMSEYLDLSPFNSFTFQRLDRFSFDKVAVLLLLWTRLQMHRFLQGMQDADYLAATKLLQQKSKFLNFVISSAMVFNKILFVATLIGMMAMLML